MKTLSLVILTFLVIYNPKVVATDRIHPMESSEASLDSITILKKNPLKDIDQNLASYREVMVLAKNFQIYNIDLANKLLLKVQNHQTLSGDDLYLIKRTFEMFFKLNMKMTEFGNLYEFRASSMTKTFTDREVNIPLVKAHLIYLSSKVMLMDHLESIHKVLYLTDGGFRRIFKNSVDAENLTAIEKDMMSELALQISLLTETVESTKFIQQVIFVRTIAPEIMTILYGEQDAIHVLSEISNNKISKDIAQGRKSFQLASSAMYDAIIGIFNKITNFLSGLFGNIAGSIQWRKGFLFDEPTAVEIAKSSLRPMDIILEKSPFVLTDKLIPGHYGHVAIYLGTKPQLESIGMWNHPDIIPYHQDIEQGNTILEAVRPGVRLNSVEAFMNIDEFTIIRKSDGLSSTLQIAEEITRGIDQLGKEYDFNFDISTLDKIVCSELIYIVYGNVTWPTQYRFGRPTITPDDVAEILFYKNTKFQMINYVVSTERHKIGNSSIFKLAEILDYEMRTINGDPVKDPKDPANSFWKKETKCYNVAGEEDDSLKKTCKTTYKEFYYEETAGL